MKLILAIIRDEDIVNVTQELIGAGFRVTRIASTGGFWRSGNTTVMIGLEDEKVDQAIKIMKDSCTTPKEKGAYRATLFVLNVTQYEHF